MIEIFLGRPLISSVTCYNVPTNGYCGVVDEKRNFFLRQNKWDDVP